MDRKWNVTVVRHGGSMIGYKSDMVMLPEHGVGAVILTNADTGSMLASTFGRRLLEVLFDGKPEAMENLLTASKNWKTAMAKERERLVVPADPTEAAKLAPRYRNAALGDIIVRTANSETIFDFGEWKSAVASRKNDDGSMSFRTIDPGAGGFGSWSRAIRSCSATVSTNTSSRRNRPLRRMRRDNAEARTRRWPSTCCPLSLSSPPSPLRDLPDRNWRLRYEMDPHLRPADYMQRLLHGWRRFGYTMFRPACPSCRMCQSLRVSVATFRPNSSLRRVWNRNQGKVTVRVGAPALSQDRLDLWARFHRHGHETKGW